jgi:hypothetical protein
MDVNTDAASASVGSLQGAHLQGEHSLPCRTNAHSKLGSAPDPLSRLASPHCRRRVCPQPRDGCVQCRRVRDQPRVAAAACRRSVLFQVSLAGFCGRIRRSLAHRVPVQEQQFFAAATGPAVVDHSEVTTTSEHGVWARLATSGSKYLLNQRLIVFACFFFHSFPHHRSACASLDRGCGPRRGPCLSAAPCIPLCRAGRPRAGAGLVPIHR